MKFFERLEVFIWSFISLFFWFVVLFNKDAFDKQLDYTISALLKVKNKRKV